jgi:hypothetical protein
MTAILCSVKMLSTRSRTTETALVLFGALLGSTVGLFVPAELPLVYLVIFLQILFLLLFYGVQGHRWLCKKWYTLTRGGLVLSPHPLVRVVSWIFGDWITAILLQPFIAKHGSRWPLKNPRIAVLNDLGWDPTDVGRISTYTGISPEEWCKAIRKSLPEHVEIDLITARKNFDPYIMVLNPYGGVYPEYDVEHNGTLTKILDYVRAGGVFVNVADVPCFWAYPLLERKRRRRIGWGISRPDLEKGVDQLRTPLVDRLGVPVYGYNEPKWPLVFEKAYDIKLESCPTVLLDRVMQAEWKTGTGFEPLVDAVICPRKVGRLSVTPFCRVDFGEGEFLISTLLLRGLEPQIRRQLRDVIAQVVGLVAESKVRVRFW